LHIYAQLIGATTRRASITLVQSVLLEAASLVSVGHRSR